MMLTTGSLGLRRTALPAQVILLLPWKRKKRRPPLRPRLAPRINAGSAHVAGEGAPQARSGQAPAPPPRAYRF